MSEAEQAQMDLLIGCLLFAGVCAMHLPDEASISEMKGAFGLIMATVNAAGIEDTPDHLTFAQIRLAAMDANPDLQAQLLHDGVDRARQYAKDLGLA